MSPSLALLFAGAFHAVLLMAHGTYIALAHGVTWGTGRRDKPVSVTDLGRRFDRSVTNNTESMIAFVPIAVAVVLFEVKNEFVEQAAFVYVVARTVFVGLYLFNIPYLRTVIWFVGQASIFSLAVAVVMGIR